MTTENINLLTTVKLYILWNQKIYLRVSCSCMVLFVYHLFAAHTINLTLDTLIFCKRCKLELTETPNKHTDSIFISKSLSYWCRKLFKGLVFPSDLYYNGSLAIRIWFNANSLVLASLPVWKKHFLNVSN